MKKTILMTAITMVIAIISFIPAAFAANQSQLKPTISLNSDLTAPWMVQLSDGKAPPHLMKNLRGMQRTMVLRRAQFLRQIGVLRGSKTIKRSTPMRKIAARSRPLKKSIKPQISPDFLPQMVSYQSNEKQGTIIIDTKNRFLYLVLGKDQARRYGIGVGKAGFEWTGTEKITRKAEWPSWRPPEKMIAREKKRGRILPTYMEGGLNNPLGARALYLGTTLYRIHGTNQPATIGQAVSSGCIRMRNQDVIDLYERARIGASVHVI